MIDKKVIFAREICTEFEVCDVIPGMDETRERRLSEKTLGEIPQT